MIPAVARSSRVPGGVAADVVGLLEVVDVDEQQRERAIPLAGDGDLLVELVLEGAVVPEAGEAVAERVEPRAVVGLAEAVALLVQPLRPGRGAT